MCAAVYPPVLEDIEVLGYVQDTNGRGYSRDIGRSFELGGQKWMHFGDTFCKDASGEFVGISDNTVALIPNPKDILWTQYLQIDEKGMVEPFIGQQLSEFKKDLSNPARMVLWSFGGVVELEDKTGRAFFEKSIVGGNQPAYCGSGVASIRVEEVGTLAKWLPKSTRKLKLHVERLQPKEDTDEWGMLFGPDEPRIGSLSALVYDSFVYLWSLYKSNIILARTPRCLTTWRHHYDFWNGDGWVKDYHEACPIDSMNSVNIAQGGIFYCDHLFGNSAENDKSFVFVGVSGKGDSVIMVGVADRVEGPWDFHAVGTATCIDKEDGFQYCIYPHPWASDLQNGELLVTWSEQWPGAVIAARLRLKRKTPNEVVTPENNNGLPAV